MVPEDFVQYGYGIIQQGNLTGHCIPCSEIVGIEHVRLRLEKMHAFLVIIQGQGGAIALTPVVHRLRPLEKGFRVIVQDGQTGDNQDKNQQLTYMPAFFIHRDIGWA